MKTIFRKYENEIIGIKLENNIILKNSIISSSTKWFKGSKNRGIR